MNIPDEVSRDTFAAMVRWSMENPSPGQKWAGRRRLQSEFSCKRQVARNAQIEARQRVEDGLPAPQPGEAEQIPEEVQGTERSREEIILWALTNPSDASGGGIVASGDMIYDHFEHVPRRESREIAQEATLRARELLGQSACDSVGDEVEFFRKSDNEMHTSFVMATPPGEKPSLAEAMENPKLKRAVSSGEILLEEFRVKKFSARTWDSPMKLKEYEGETSTGMPITTTRSAPQTLHYIAIEWERKAPTPVLTALRRIVDRLPEAHKPQWEGKAPEPGAVMCELAMYDIHYGLLAWAAETGQNYDVNIAHEVMCYGFDQLANRTKHLDIDHYLIPIGNDLFHVNDVRGVTPKGENRLDVDTRFAGIIERAEASLLYGIDKLRQIAPVKMIWIPGNHDPQTSYMMLRILNGWHSRDSRVEIDLSPKTRKLESFGPNLIGFIHGCEIPKSRLKTVPGIIMEEAIQADMLAKDQYREVHMGHKHIKGKLEFEGLSSQGTFAIRSIPSIAGTDFWHFNSGFVNGPKICQYFLWPKNTPLEGCMDIHVPRELYDGSIEGNVLRA